MRRRVGLEDAADNVAVGHHVVIVVLPLAGWTASRGAFEDEVVLLQSATFLAVNSHRTAGVMATVDDQSLYSSMLATAALRALAHWLESFR